MNCGPHREEAPARDFLAIHSQTKLPPETSSIFRPEEPKIDDSYRSGMTHSDYSYELWDP